MSAALLLSSCGLYNKYERPEVKTDGIVRDPLSLTDTLAVKDTTSFGNMPWRSVFTDPQLQTLIQQGLDQNPDLKGMYKVGDSNTAVMYIEDGVATYNTFAGAPRTVSF